MKKRGHPADKISFSQYSHSMKLKVVQEIENGLISKNYASKKYLASRSSIDYWCKKLGTIMSDNDNHSLKKENKKLKERIEELEFMNRVRRDALEEMFKKFGDEAKKSFPKQLEEMAREMEKRKKG